MPRSLLEELCPTCAECKYLTHMVRWRFWNRTFQSRVLEWYGSKFRPAEFVTATSSLSTASCPGIQYPRVPGHEVVGVIDAIGPDVARWQVGQRVGVGWHGGNCGYCDACRRGNLFACETETRITGITYDGGYADFMIARAEALAAVPEGLSAADAAPLMCAGVTTFNCLRNSGARPGDVVAILGLGGLGHLGVQFAAKMGYKTIGIARGQDKGSLARELGAAHYIDSEAATLRQNSRNWVGPTSFSPLLPTPMP